VKRKTCINLLILSIFSNSLYAENKAPAERGIHFGEYKDINKTKKDKKKTTDELLADLIDLNKKQLKVQKEIRDILSDEFSPKPKYIEVDGVKCIENSSAKCFKMPMINEVKKIPVIANAYKNPTLENIKKREMWYAKYTDRVLSDVYLKKQAIRDLGNNYPLDIRPTGSIDRTGFDSVVSDKYRINVVKKFNDRFEYNLFLGLNDALDAYSIVHLGLLRKTFKNISLNLIFKNENDKNKWLKKYKIFIQKKLDINIVIDEVAFENFKIETTPSLFLKDKILKKDKLINVGRISKTIFTDKIIDYMLYNKIIKRQDLNAVNSWNNLDDETLRIYYKDKGINYEK